VRNAGLHGYNAGMSEAETSEPTLLCPDCGDANVVSVALCPIEANASLKSGSELPLPSTWMAPPDGPEYRCLSCHHEWPVPLVDQSVLRSLQASVMILCAIGVLETVIATTLFGLRLVFLLVVIEIAVGAAFMSWIAKRLDMGCARNRK